eukprot:TRINITY_DN674_c0_g1_i5.p1 TRINITY_DN674_c0_g1~~TRINITY_DN674_c0_g1_i5.p1  ORF type:complete len:1421 (+),score=247.89 TRINITY_DN674_c0_g1_i5:68-4330(+)
MMGDGWFDSSSEELEVDSTEQKMTMSLCAKMDAAELRWIEKQCMSLDMAVVLSKTKKDYLPKQEASLTTYAESPETHFEVELDPGIATHIRQLSESQKQSLSSLACPNMKITINKLRYGSALEVPHSLSALTSSCLCCAEAFDGRTTKRYAIPAVMLRLVSQSTSEPETVPAATYEVRFSTPESDNVQQCSQLVAAMVANAVSKIVYYDIGSSTEEENPNYWKAFAMAVFTRFPDTAVFYNEQQKRISICGIASREVLRTLQNQRNEDGDRTPFAMSVGTSVSPIMCDSLSDSTGACVASSNMHEMTTMYGDIPPVTCWLLSHTRRSGRRYFLNNGRFTINTPHETGSHPGMVDMKSVFEQTEIKGSYFLLRQNCVVSLDKESAEKEDENTSQPWSHLRSEELGRVVSVGADGGRASVQLREKSIIFDDVGILKRVPSTTADGDNWVGIYGTCHQRQLAFNVIRTIHRQVTEVIRIPETYHLSLYEWPLARKKPKHLKRLDHIPSGMIVESDAISVEYVKRLVSAIVHKFEEKYQQRCWNQYLQNDLLPKIHRISAPVSINSSCPQRQQGLLSSQTVNIDGYIGRIHPSVKRDKPVRLTVDIAALSAKSLTLITEAVDYLGKVMETVLSSWRQPKPFKVELASCMTNLQTGTIHGNVPVPGDIVSHCIVSPEPKSEQSHTDLTLSPYTVHSIDKFYSGLMSDEEGDWVYPHFLLQTVGFKRDFGKIPTSTEPKRPVWKARVTKLEIPTQENNGFSSACTEWLSYSLLSDGYITKRPTCVKATVVTDKSTAIEIHAIPVEYAQVGPKTPKEVVDPQIESVLTAVQKVVFTRWCYLVDNCLLPLMAKLATQSGEVLYMKRALSTTYRVLDELTSITNSAKEAVNLLVCKDLQQQLHSLITETKSLWTVCCEASRFSLKQNIDKKQHQITLSKYQSRRTLSSIAQVAMIESESGVIVQEEGEGEVIDDNSSNDKIKRTEPNPNFKRRKLDENDDPTALIPEYLQTIRRPGYLSDPEPDFRIPAGLRQFYAADDSSEAEDISICNLRCAKDCVTCSHERELLSEMSRVSRHIYRSRGSIKGDPTSVKIAKKRLEAAACTSGNPFQSVVVAVPDDVAKALSQNGGAMMTLLLNDITGIQDCKLKGNLLSVSGNQNAIAAMVKATTGESWKGQQQQPTNNKEEATTAQHSLRHHFKKIDSLSQEVLVCDCGRWLAPIPNSKSLIRCPDCSKGQCAQCGNEHYFSECCPQPEEKSDNNLPAAGYAICRHCSAVIQQHGWVCTSCINSFFCDDCHSRNCSIHPTHTLREVNLENREEGSWNVPPFLCRKGHRLTRSSTTKGCICSICESMLSSSNSLVLSCLKCDVQFCPNCKPVTTSLIPQHELPRTAVKSQHAAYKGRSETDVPNFEIDSEDYSLSGLLHLNAIQT